MPNIYEAEYQTMIDIARSHLRPEWKSGQVTVVKTTKGNYVFLEIPDYMDPAVREPLENQWIQSLMEQQEAQIQLCLNSMDGQHPEIMSWNLLSKLLQADEKNRQAEIFCWGGDRIFVRTLESRLPPKKNP